MKTPPAPLKGWGREFINVSVNGAHIKDISEMIDNFHATSPAAKDIEKVILSFGTNDIKIYESNHKREIPYEELVRKAKVGKRVQIQGGWGIFIPRKFRPIPQ